MPSLYCVAEFQRGEYRLKQRRGPYEDAELLEAFESRDAPEREFIYRAFLGGRF